MDNSGSDLIQAIENDNFEKVVEFINTATPDKFSSIADSLNLIFEKAVSNDSIAKVLRQTVETFAKKHDNGTSILDQLSKTETGTTLIKDVLIKPLAIAQNIEILERMAMCGWSDFSLPSDSEVTEEVKSQIAKLTDLRIKATLIQAAIRDGRLEDVKTILTDSKILRTAGISGLLPLHQAVVYNNENIVKHILTTFSDAYGINDSMGRIALHYAAGCRDEGNMYQILKDIGSDEELQDAIGNTPKYYSEHPDQIEAADIKAKLESLMKGGGGPGSRPASAKQNEDNADTTTAATELNQAEAKPDKQDDTAVSKPEPESQRTPTPPRSKTPPGPKKVKPVPMYSRCAGNNQAQAPPPTTLDGKYIAQHLGTALTLALAEIAEKRPWDPIEYLAQWLYTYHKNEAYAKKQAEMMKAIREAETRQNEIEELKFKRKEEFQRMHEDDMRKKKEEEEEKRRQELEELQRSNKEAALAQKPQLPTVREDEEAETETEAEVDDDPNVKDRDLDGLTEMHKLASQPDIDLKSLIDLGYSVADRDTKGRSVRDIAQEAGRKDTVLAIDNYIKQLLSDGIVSTLERLVLEGYDDIDSLADEKVPEVTIKFLESKNDLKEKMTQITNLSETGKEDEVKEILESSPQLTQMKAQNGQSLLHRAVICDNTPVIEYLSTQHPTLLQVRDNKNRTPLHYAYSKSEDIAKLLITKGAKQNSRDVFKKLPVYYKDHSTVESPSQSEPVTVSEPNSQEQVSTNSINTEQSSENLGEPETTPETSLLATTSVTSTSNPDA